MKNREGKIIIYVYDFTLLCFATIHRHLHLLWLNTDTKIATISVCEEKNKLNSGKNATN